jgi:nicotinamide riboside kinase
MAKEIKSNCIRKPPHSLLTFPQLSRMKKIVIIGPESTGKSTLSQQLAAHYQTLWCLEYAREYLMTHGADYTYDDLLTIAKGQVALEEEYVEKVKTEWPKVNGEPHNNTRTLPASVISKPSSSPLLFFDTNMYVTKVWCEYVYGKCHKYIIEQIKERKYDLYLLTNVDLPWVKDELREYPDLKSREELYNIYKQLLINQPEPWVSIHGDYEQRFQLATKAIDELYTTENDR